MLHDLSNFTKKIIRFYNFYNNPYSFQHPARLNLKKKKKPSISRRVSTFTITPSHRIEIIAIKLVLPLSGTGSRRPPPKWISLIFEYTPGIWALHCKFSWPFEKWNGWRFILISIHWRSSWSEWASLRSHLCCGWCLVCDSTCEKSNVNWIRGISTRKESGNESNSVAREHVTVYGMDEKGKNNIGKRGMESRKCKSAFNEIRSSGIEKRTFRFASSNPPPFSLSISLALHPISTACWYRPLSTKTTPSSSMKSRRTRPFPARCSSD